MWHMTGPAVAAAFQLNGKGRGSIPKSVRDAAHVAADATLVAYADGDGRLVLETREAVSRRLRAQTAGATQGDAVAEVRQMRQDDEALSRRATDERAQAGGPDSDAVGAAFLSSLGL